MRATERESVTSRLLNDTEEVVAKISSYGAIKFEREVDAATAMIGSRTLTSAIA